MNKSELKSAVTKHYKERSEGCPRFVWTWKGKYPTGLPGCTAYFIVKVGVEKQLHFAQWSQGYPLKVRRMSHLSWDLLSKQDMSVIRGASGQVPAPSH